MPEACHWYNVERHWKICHTAKVPLLWYRTLVIDLMDNYKARKNGCFKLNVYSVLGS